MNFEVVRIGKYGSLVPNLASLVARTTFYATRDARFGTRDPYFLIRTPSAFNIPALFAFAPIQYYFKQRRCPSDFFQRSNPAGLN